MFSLPSLNKPVSKSCAVAESEHFCRATGQSNVSPAVVTHCLMLPLWPSPWLYLRTLQLHFTGIRNHYTSFVLSLERLSLTWKVIVDVTKPVTCPRTAPTAQGIGQTCEKWLTRFHCVDGPPRWNVICRNQEQSVNHCFTLDLVNSIGYWLQCCVRMFAKLSPRWSRLDSPMIFLFGI